MEVFPCDECGVEVSSYEQLKEHMRKMHESPEKSFGSFGRVRDFGEQEQNKRKVPKFEDMDNLEFQDEDDLNDFDQNEEGHENPAFSGFDDESEDQSIHGEEIGAEYHDEINERFNGQFWDEEYDHEERQEEYYNEDDEYDIDEMEDNEIEVISSGVKNLPKFDNEIEVIEHNRNTSPKRRQGKPSLIVRNNSLDSLKNRYSQITINRKDDSDDGSSYDEDNTDISEDEDVYQVPNPEEITLDDEPDEITLDEGEEDIEDVTTIQVEENRENESMEKIQFYLTMIANTDYVKSLDENQEKLQSFNQHAWYAKPVTWKPSKVGELWHATVPQICSHFQLEDYPPMATILDFAGGERVPPSPLDCCFLFMFIFFRLIQH